MILAMLLTACGQPARTPVPVQPGGCPEGELADGDTCVPEACGTGTWGALPVDDGTVHVDAGAPPQGTGTADSPLPTVQAGLERAAELGGGLVAVAAGTYLEAISLDQTHDGVTLAGRCRELVFLDGSESDGAATIDIYSRRATPEIRVQGLTVTGGASSGLWVENAALTLTATDIVDNDSTGLLATNASLTLTDVRVSRTQPSRNGLDGVGIDASFDVVLTATRCVLDGNAQAALFAEGSGTTVAFVDSAVSDTLPNRDGLGRGIEAQSGATVTLTRSTVQGSADVGVMATGEGTTLHLVDSQVIENHGYGVAAQAGATLTATGSRFDSNTDIGVYASDSGTVVELDTSGVAWNTPEAPGSLGFGLDVESGAALALTDCVVQGNTAVGLFANGQGTSVTVVDTVIVDTVPSPDGLLGLGVAAQEGAWLAATGCRIEGNTAEGVLADGDESTVDLTDTSISRTRSDEAGTGGQGIVARHGAAVRATRCTLEANSNVGVAAADAGTVVDLVDTAVRGTLRTVDSGGALGLGAQDGGLVHLLRSEVSATEGVGGYVVAGGVLELEDSSLTDNRFAGAVALGGTISLRGTSITGNVADEEWGGGLGIYANATFGVSTLSVVDCEIGPHPYAGVWLDGQGFYEIEQSSVSGGLGVPSGSHTLHGNSVFAENGVTAWGEAGGLLLSGNTFEGASEVAVLLDAASASLEANSWSGNGTDLLQQRCTDLEPLQDPDLSGVPNAIVCPEGSVLTAYDLLFTSLYLPVTETEP